MEIRDVVDSDWAAIWGFMQQILDAGDTYCWPTNTSEEGASVVDGQARRSSVVAVDDGAVVGTPNSSKSAAAGDHVANAGFMVSPAATGKGVGRALAHHVLEVAVKDGYAAMQFNAVVETNEPAVRL